MKITLKNNNKHNPKNAIKGRWGAPPPLQSFQPPAELQLPLSILSTSPHHKTTHVSLMPATVPDRSKEQVLNDRQYQYQFCFHQQQWLIPPNHHRRQCHHDHR